MDTRLNILQHALGLDQYGEGVPFRNHFVTGTGSRDYEDCCALVEAGLMAPHNGGLLTDGRESCSTVPCEGKSYVATQSPRRPLDVRIPGSPPRYRGYQEVRVGVTFADWIHDVQEMARPGHRH